MNNAVLIQQATGEHQRLLRLTSHLHNQYCEKHRFDFWQIYGVPQGHAADRMPMWNKVVLLRQAIEAGYEYVVWLDADCLIVDHETDLRDACPLDGIGLVWCAKDWGALADKCYDHFNTGAVYLSAISSLKVPVFLDTWWNTSDSGHCWGDQHALNLCVKESSERSEFVLSSPVKQIDARWNSIYPAFLSPEPVVMAWHGYGQLPERFAAMHEQVEKWNERFYDIGETVKVHEAAARHRARQSVSLPTVPVDIVGQKFNEAYSLQTAKQFQAAAAIYAAICEYAPNVPEVLREYGVTLGSLGREEEAEGVLRRSLALLPNCGATWSVLGTILYNTGRPHEALEAYNRALVLSPDMPGAHYNRSLVRLLLGDYEEGWKEFEWGVVHGQHRKRTLRPEWRGERIEGKTLCVWMEQGFGDFFMMARFLPLVKEISGARIVLEVHDSLVSFVSTQGWADTVVAMQLDGGFPFACDCHVSMMSLPRVLGLRIGKSGELVRGHTACPDTFNDWGDPPYIRPPRTIEPETPGLNVGICWQGNAVHGNDRNRSTQIEQWKDILSVEGVTFHSLQYGQPAPAEVETYRLNSWDETAAIIAGLDLVISVDTAVAHLAGAMGKVVLLLLPYAGDFRWGVGDWVRGTPWYPTAELVQQQKRDDWFDVFGYVQTELKSQVKKARNCREAANAPL